MPFRFFLSFFGSPVRIHENMIRRLAQIAVETFVIGGKRVNKLKLKTDSCEIQDSVDTHICDRADYEYWL